MSDRIKVRLQIGVVLVIMVILPVGAAIAGSTPTCTVSTVTGVCQ